MKILSRYLVAQLTLPFVFAMSICTSLMLVNTIARRLEDVIGKGLPWSIIFEFFALSIVYILAVTLSMAVLVSILYTFTRMAGDREITALRAGGVSLGRLLRPVLAAGVAVTIVAFLFNDQVLPRTNHRLRSLMTDIYRTKPTFTLKEHTINRIQRGRYSLRATEIDQATYRLRDVTVYDLSEPNQKRIVYADSGYMAFALNQEDLQLTLYDGSIHQFDRSDPRMFQHTQYSRQVIVMRGVGNEFVRREQDDYRGDREMGVCDLESVVLAARKDVRVAERRAQAAQANGLRRLVGLPALEPDTAGPELKPSIYCRMLNRLAGWFGTPELEAQEPTQRAQRDSVARAARRSIRPLTPRSVSGAGTPARTRLYEVRVHRDRARSARVREAVYLVELHKKYAIPAASIVFVLVGVPIAIRFPRGGVGLVIGASMAVFTLYYIFLIAGETLANRLVIAPVWVMWSPNVIIGLLGLAGLWWVRREGTIGGPRRRPAMGS